MADMMTFPDTWEEFEEQYGITDREQIYTNGSRLIPSFRVKQWLDHLADYVPKDFHDKTCEEMAKRHQEEIANMVSVVRCKECLYWRAHETWSECERWTDDPYESAKTKADDFCSCGEREGE